MILVLMGVCGSGKTAVGSFLANQLGWTLFDGDDYHPMENIDRMAKGIPLCDEDRIPWLLVLHDIILREMSSGRNAILICSALKRVYRETLLFGTEISNLKCREEQRDRVKGILFVYLHGSIELISKRMATRKGHFMAPSLIQSQFDILEPPSASENSITLDIEKSIPEIAAEIESALPSYL
ncbi:probable gluconokinase isoform X2 [Amia ocellicauda]|uniref:probable gluconokinase isoform X2 n=1 Tax=Amia ocellicauda TaxID=2972642 RepID=UPI0034646052